IATSPLVKQNAMATHSAASVIGGSATLLRSGHGRCNRPEVAVILAASQRLSVSVIIANIAAAAGAIITRASIHCSVSAVGATPRNAKIRCKNRRKAPVMAAVSVPSVSSAAMVVNAAKPVIQSRMRPTGYHSKSGATGEAPLPGGTPSERRHHQWQGRQIKQQQRDQRARDDRGEHQRRGRAGRYGNENGRDHQLSRSFRAVRGFKSPNHRRPDDPAAL